MQNKSSLVFEDLVKKIDNQVYAVGDFLPSENRLCDLYGISRETVRKALTGLTEGGYIQKIRGKGSVVIEHRQYEFPVSGIVSYKELAQQLKIETRNEVFTLQEGELPYQQFQAMDTSLTAIPVTVIGRVRWIDGEPVIIDWDYIVKKVIPTVPRSAAEDSLYAYFEKTLQLKIAYANKQITVEPATENDRQRLSLKKGAYVAVVRSITCLADTTEFQFTESRHRVDKFVFRDFARRK